MHRNRRHRSSRNNDEGRHPWSASTHYLCLCSPRGSSAAHSKSTRVPAPHVDQQASLRLPRPRCTHSPSYLPTPALRACTRTLCPVCLPIFIIIRTNAKGTCIFITPAVRCYRTSKRTLYRLLPLRPTDPRTYTMSYVTYYPLTLPRILTLPPPFSFSPLPYTPPGARLDCSVSLSSRRVCILDVAAVCREPLPSFFSSLSSFFSSLRLHLHPAVLNRSPAYTFCYPQTIPVRGAGL